jgi:hypothetical protein
MKDKKRASAVSKKMRRPMALKTHYLKTMGLFQTTWAGIELSTDFAIYKFLKITPEQAHLITSGQMFGRKARLLADLIGRSDHPDKAKILKAFNEVRNKNLRDTFFHCYMQSSGDDVTYIERPAGGDFRATPHIFTLLTLTEHVRRVMEAAEAFYESLAPDSEELEAFVNAALSLRRKSKTSPGRPASSA